MRCVVEGCSPARSLISFNGIASSREASTSISVNMRSMTWTAGVLGGSRSFLVMVGLCARCYLAQPTARR